MGFRSKIIAGALMVLGALSFFLAAPRPAAAGNQVVINMKASVVKKTPHGYTGGWDPRKITVQEGDEVVIHLKSVDAEHMFFLEGYNIEKDVAPGSPVDIHFTADKAGIFYYYCHMECGPFHKAMIGQLTVNKK